MQTTPGREPVGGHRRPAFGISPYARRGIVDSTLYTQINVVRTIEQDQAPMNPLYLAAVPMRSAFTDRADLSPYTALPRAAGAGCAPASACAGTNPGSRPGPGSQRRAGPPADGRRPRGAQPRLQAVTARRERCTSWRRSHTSACQGKETR